MTCPDDDRLEYWLDEALPAHEAAHVEAHVADCEHCARRSLRRLAEDRLWQAALALDGAELAYLARANLAGAWRRAPAWAASSPAHWWPALVLLAAVAAYAAWVTALPLVAEGTGWLSRLGLLGMALGWLVTQLLAGVGALATALDDAPLDDPTLLLAAASFALWLFVARPWTLARAD